MTNIADDVKCRLHRVANSLTNENAPNAANYFRNWDHFKGKLRNWFNGKVTL